MIEKLTMQTPDIMNKNVEQIGNIFPEVITEIRDKSGQIIKGIDFDLLKQKLSNVLEEDENERYRLDWPGKKASLLKANISMNKTLSPLINESMNFESTQNLFIEGDNFEAMRILQESYLHKVKMIYFDPPYNTGGDFIYKDNFKMSVEEYSDNIRAIDEGGGKLFRNTDSNGRFHSDWLSMMFERLIVARDFLSEDGLIFISLDENEQHNLKLCLNEVFGEDNFICEFIWKNKHGGGGDSPYAVKEHEYIFCYAKNITTLPELFASPPTHYEKMFREKDERGPFYYDRLDKKGIDSNRPNLIYPIECPDGSIKDISPAIWRLSENEFLRRKANNEIGFKEDKNGEWQIYTKTYLYDEEGKRRKVKARSILKQEIVGFTQNGNKELSKLLGPKIFQNPKPVALIKYLVDYAVPDNSGIIMDLFAGSSTTAHAVMQLNAEDGGYRKFIMVQYPELIDVNSKANKEGYITISDIGKERIRRAGRKIKEEYLEKYQIDLDNINDKLRQESLEGNDILQQQKVKLQSNIEHIKSLDVGFRVYKTDSSNMKDIFYHPTELKQEQLSAFESNIKEDRTPEDLLTQVILNLGLELSLSIEKQEILGNNVFIVQENALVACFDDNINFGIVDKISDLKPFKVVFKDSSFKDDKDRINVEERFKRLSPETKVTVI